MANFQAKRSFFTPRVRAWLAIVALALLCVVLGRGAWGIYQKNRLAGENKDATQQRLAEIEERQKTVEAKLAKIKTKQGLEEEIRQALPVAKEGEHLIVIVDEEKTIGGEGKTTATTTKSGFWTALLRGL